MAILSTDLVVIATDAAGNMLVPPRLVGGLEAVRIGADTRLKLIMGEWFLDLDAGVPWLPRPGVPPERAILGSKFSEPLLRREVQLAIMDTPGVIEITELKISFDAVERTASITWRARTRFGDTGLQTTPGIGA